MKRIAEWTGRVAVLLLAAWPAAADLEEGFRTPPASARPHTWWHWMDGNITREGITADLEAMQQAGIGGVQTFDVSCGIPSGPVDYNSPAWRDAMVHAMAEAKRLGLEFCMHNCAGWSSSGGTWVRPEDAMKMTVYAEVHAAGPGRFAGALPQPHANSDFYRDIAVYAFPTPPDEQATVRDLKPKVTAAAGKGEAASLLDVDSRTGIQFAKPTAGAPPWVAFDFAQPMAARTFRLVPLPPLGDRRFPVELLASDDGKKYRRLGRWAVNRGLLQQAFGPCTARFYKVQFPADARGSAPAVGEINLSATARPLGDAGHIGLANLRGHGLDAAEAPGIKRTDILNLTDRVKPDGTLDWEIPAGRWTILRLGYTTTGKDNHPARDSGRGPEVDKLSAESLDRFFDGILEPLIAQAGPLAGSSFTSALIDSYEVGCQNWTARMCEEFQRRRGYDPAPYLPALAGRLVDDGETTGRFLWDFRRTIAELFAERYSGRMAERLARHGMTLAIEPYGNGNFDSFSLASPARLPMGEFWIGQALNPSVKLAASVGHVFGRPVIGAEALTASPSQAGWRSHPYPLKAYADRGFAAGINRLIFHRYAHQPWTNHVLPGMTMGQWGSHLERTQTWWPLAPAWHTYLARCQYLLQSGTFAADVCAFVGEHQPNAEPGAAAAPKVPPGYGYDLCGLTPLMDMTVRDGRVVLPSGMSYAVLALADTDRMTPALARKIRDLVRAGAVVHGPKPVKSPSLVDLPKGDAEVASIAAEVWGPCDGKAATEHAFGKGRVVWGRPLEDLLAALGLRPDFRCAEQLPADSVNWIHRRADDADFYFVSCMQEAPVTLTCAFRTAGRRPELWHPESGRIEDAVEYRRVEGGVELPLRLDPAGSVFVVFRRPDKGFDPVASVAAPPALGGAAAEAVPSRLEIVKAEYGVWEGARFRGRDVTKVVAGQVRGGGLRMRAGNSLFEDPVPDVVKSFRMTYKLDGRERTLTAAENEAVSLGEETVSMPPPAWELGAADGGKIALRAWAAGWYTVKTAAGREATVDVSLPAPLAVEGPWAVRFPPGWDAPETAVFEKLASWTTRPEFGIKYFSGTATYARRFSVPEGFLAAGRRVILDLGAVRELAQVTLNGRDVGTRWKPPFRLDVTEAVKAGDNVLEVKVTNLWVNRLIGDEQFPADVEWNGMQLARWPEWFLQGEPRPEPRRRTFTTWHHNTKDTPLIDSGLMGPVYLRAVEVRVLDLGGL